MNSWKSLSLVLATLFTVSLLSIGYLYTQTSGFTGVAQTSSQSKIVTLLKKTNLTNLDVDNPFAWNASVDTVGYKTGFLYCQVFENGKVTRYQSSAGGHNPPTERVLEVYVHFETDDISVASNQPLYFEVHDNGTSYVEVNLAGSLTRVLIFGTYQWAVVSMSLYLRD